ncbi:MAG: hypothetical protein ACWA6Y_02575 [Polaromonas sp.]
MKDIDTRAKEELAKPAHAGARPEAASTAIRSALSTGERVPLAVMDAKGLQSLQIAPDAKAASGYATQTVWLSDDTAIKQALHRRGQDLSVHSYTRLQQVLDSAQYVQAEGATKLIYYHEGADWALAVIKATRAGEELFLVSLRKSSQREVDAAIKSGKAVQWAR